MYDVSAGQARISIRPDDIVAVTTENQRTQTVEEAVAVINAVRQILRGRRIPMLLTLAGAGGVTTDARDHYSTHAPGLTTALGIVTTSLVGRVIANFIVALNHDVMPLRLFSEEASAIAWLKTHRNSQGSTEGSHGAWRLQGPRGPRAPGTCSQDRDPAPG